MVMFVPDNSAPPALASLSLAGRCQALGRSRLFAGLAQNECEVLARLAAERRVARDEVVLRRGDRDASLLVLVAGQLRVGAVSIDGREVGHALLDPGAVLGEISLLDGGPRSADVTALTDGLVLVLDRRGFLPFLTAHPAVMLQLMAVLCERLRRSSGAYEALALSPLSVRLAQLLLNLAKGVAPGPGGLVIPTRLSQRELAMQVAATRERVNKQLRLWQQLGVLGTAGGLIVIRDLVALRAAAE